MRSSNATPPPVFTTHDSHHSSSTGEFNSVNPGDPTPKYDLSLSREFRQWKAADEASQRLSDLNPVLEDLKKGLEISQNELRLLKEKSANLFNELHSNTSPKILSFISRKKNEESNTVHTENVKASFETAHQAEVKRAQEVQQLETQVSELSKNIDELAVIAAETDNAWTRLQHTVNTMPRTHGDNKVIYTAEDSVLNSEAAYDLATNAVKDMTRARQTIQHAHHYFQTALRTYDAIRGAMSKTIGSFGEIGRRNDYRECVSFSERAQACLDEYFRVMQNYLYTLPEDRRADHDALKELGLMQMQKIENVLYGGSVMSSGQGTAAHVSFREIDDKQAREGLRSSDNTRYMGARSSASGRAGEEDGRGGTEYFPTGVG
ncbi:hypothetical protein BD410DRAFT_115334 [Rickenella mellea]|uniref:Uncharacterized protein n=1 Tax=Rickenella mellea TaxID=50990 RepID=A0A4Y7Q9J6_9AGAM|nr:hypothetical protein BD410DRAFT_115334 [Rickenella mellea]